MRYSPITVFRSFPSSIPKRDGCEKSLKPRGVDGGSDPGDESRLPHADPSSRSGGDEHRSKGLN